MGYQLIGGDADVASWTSGGTEDVTTALTKLKEANASLSVSTTAQDITGLGETAAEAIGGLRDWSATIDGVYPATPALGNVSSLTITGAYTTKVTRFSITLTAQEAEITAMNAADAPTWRSYRPVLYSWSGTFDCDADSAGAYIDDDSPSAPANTGLSMAAIIVPTNAILTGTVHNVQFQHTINTGQKQLLRYSFQGTDAITMAGTDSLFGAGAVGLPDWDADGDGVPDVILTIRPKTSATTRTYAGAAWWRSVTFDCEVGGVNRVSIDARGCGPLTVNGVELA